MSLQFSFGPASGGEPMPVIPITLRDGAGHTTAILSAILDTGSDGTFAPLSLLKAAGFQAGRQRGHLFTTRTEVLPEVVIGYALTLTIGPLELAGTTVFGSREIAEVILGRDILNQLVFTYDGPRRVLDLLAP